MEKIERETRDKLKKLLGHLTDFETRLKASEQQLNVDTEKTRFEIDLLSSEAEIFEAEIRKLQKNFNELEASNNSPADLRSLIGLIQQAMAGWKRTQKSKHETSKSEKVDGENSQTRAKNELTDVELRVQYLQVGLRQLGT